MKANLKSLSIERNLGYKTTHAQSIRLHVANQDMVRATDFCVLDTEYQVMLDALRGKGPSVWLDDLNTMIRPCTGGFIVRELSTNRCEYGVSNGTFFERQIIAPGDWLADMIQVGIEGFMANEYGETTVSEVGVAEMKHNCCPIFAWVMSPEVTAKLIKDAADPRQRGLTDWLYSLRHQAMGHSDGFPVEVMLEFDWGSNEKQDIPSSYTFSLWDTRKSGRAGLLINGGVIAHGDEYEKPSTSWRYSIHT
jgi:hypothetical protein